MSTYEDPTFSPISPGATTGYVFKGCYSEATAGRAVALRQTQLDYYTMTPDMCLAACKSQAYPMAALEYYGECYCGMILGAGSTPVSPIYCQTYCNGDWGQPCGGAGFINFYVNYDMMEVQPCDPSTVQTFPTYGGVTRTYSYSTSCATYTYTVYPSGYTMTSTVVSTLASSSTSSSSTTSVSLSLTTIPSTTTTTSTSTYPPSSTYSLSSTYTPTSTTTPTSTAQTTSSSTATSTSTSSSTNSTPTATSV